MFLPATRFNRTCISRFKDCPLCGADIEKIEPDIELQVTVDRFIDGHARIRRVNANGQEVDGKKNVIYGDVSMERGAFLVQQAMRVSKILCYLASNTPTRYSRKLRKMVLGQFSNILPCTQLARLSVLLAGFPCTEYRKCKIKA